MVNTGIGGSGLNYYDIGAFEFQGDSSDTIPPRITGFLNIPANGGRTNSIFRTITFSFSEALDLISAGSRANYKLIASGPDDVFDTSDDVLYSLNPVYSFPETNVVLELINGALPDGHYKLTVSGTRAIYDTAGNPLDGDGNGIGGDDYIHYFGIDRRANRAPVIEAVSDQIAAEGSELILTVSASDPDSGDVLGCSLDSAPEGAAIDPVTGVFTWTPADGPMTVNVIVRVTDNAPSPLFDTETFTRLPKALIRGQASPTSEKVQMYFHKSIMLQFCNFIAHRPAAVNTPTLRYRSV